MSEEAVESAQITPLKLKEKPEEDFLGDEKLQVSDSDSEDDLHNNNEKSTVHVETTTSMTTLSQMKDNESGNEDKKDLQVESQKAKLSNIIDSESETEADEIVEKSKNSASSDDEDLEVQQRKKLQKKKKLKLCLEDSDDDNNNKKLSKKLSIEDSDSEEEENSQKSTQNVQQKLAALVDSESSDENETETEKPQEENKVANKKPQRASAKKAMEGMMAIQSEQQRLHREAYLNIPYHKPKRYTLQEFLNRRTILSPGTAAAKVLSKKSPKMTAEELEAYAKFLEEREREAIEFFKPEKVEEIENEPPVVAKNVLETAVEEKMPEQSSQVDEIDEVNVEEQLLTSDKPIVTEVLELPSLDLELLKKYCNVSPPANENEHTPVTVREAKTWAKIENIKRILTDKQLTESPTIKGTPDMLIDLESGDIVPKQPTGVDKLLERLIATRRARNCNATNKNVSILPEENDKQTQKPGASLIKLKESLKSIISNRRLENLKKKQRNELEVSQDDDITNEQDLEYDEEYEPSTKPKKSVQIEIDEEENAIFIEDECMEENEEEEEEEDNKDKEEEDEEEEEKEEENEEEEDNNEEEEEEDNKEEEKEEEENETTTKKRIIKPFLNDSDDEDLLKTQVPENKSANTSLLDISLNWGTANNSAIISQIPTTQPLQNMQEHEEELLELCSGTFENTCATTETQQRQPTPDKSQYIRQILSSDEEPQQEEITGKRVKKLRKKRTLALSDEDDETDESASENENEEEEEAEKGDVDVAEEEGETYVDYDSEENEVIVKVTKDELRNKIQDFVENEAELSESEWGSADEDEKNMDKYDIELGDEDQFDKDKLKDELEQIHARKMLDEDIRQVRKIQELLFDTDETDGAGRQRQFKWKNTESGFSLDDSQRDEDADKNADSEDDEDYEKNWRKLRFEREQMLQEQNVSTTQNADLENVLKTCKLTHQQRSSTTPKPALNNANAGGFLITNVHTTARASFLERDKELLSKIAGIKRSSNTVIIDDDTEEPITTISTSTKGKNFLFATITAEEHENIKRKADQLLHENDQHESLALKKRVKMDMQKNACFIDQLL